MNRRNLLLSLAGLPFVGRFVKAEESKNKIFQATVEWTPELDQDVEKIYQLLLEQVQKNNIQLIHPYIYLYVSSSSVKHGYCCSINTSPTTLQSEIYTYCSVIDERDLTQPNAYIQYPKHLDPHKVYEKLYKKFLNS